MALYASEFRSRRNSVGIGPILLTLLASSLGFAEGVEQRFELHSGGELKGVLLNPDETPRKIFKIKTTVGQVHLHAEQVKKVVAPAPREQQYVSLLSRMPDTADGNWKMAEWCRQNYLETQRQQHLSRCVKLEPGHIEARRALGYTNFDGRWTLVDVEKRKMGMIRYEQRWLLPQDVALRVTADKREKQEKQLLSQMRIWINWMERGKKGEEGKANLLKLRDPSAVSGLSKLLGDAKSVELQRTLIRALRNIGDEGGSIAIIAQVFETDSEVVRSDCFDALKELGPRRAATAFTAKLKDKDPRVINLAATGLSAVGAKESIPVLIDSLVTEHKIRISKGSPGSISPTFGSNGASGLSMGGGPKEIKRQFRNQRVRSALVALAGGRVDFGFNEEAWKNWLIQKERPVSTQLRRGN